MEYLTRTDEKYQSNWILSPDIDTSTILNSDPKTLLQDIFQNDSNRVFLLEKTGFSMPMQVQTWINLYGKAIDENSNFDEVKNQLISKTIQDVIGFYFEYLTKQDIFPISVEFKENENGDKTVFASKYNQSLESLALPTERDGALADGVKQAVEILINSEPETVVFLSSPKGWSGLDHEYPDTQTYVYWINETGNLDALTIRTNLSLESNEKLVKKISETESLQERIKTVVSSPQKIKTNNFEAVLDLIEEVSGQTFTKQRQEIQNREKLFTLNENATKIISNLRTYLTDNISHINMDSIRLFVIEVGRAVLDLANEVLPKQPVKINYNSSIIYQYGPPNYYSLSERVQAIAGCNGGGADGNYLDATLAMGFFSFVDGGPKYVRNCGACGTPINSFISSGYQCSSCKGIYLGC